VYNEIQNRFSCSDFDEDRGEIKWIFLVFNYQSFKEERTLRKAINFLLCLCVNFRGIRVGCRRKNSTEKCFKMLH
jgi:hypothetical protein